jgi:ribosome-associated protein
MSSEYINKEIDKIFNNKSLESTKEAMICAWILGNFKGINLKVMDLSKSSSVASFYVLASATNTTQSKAMATEIIHQLRRLNCPILSREGMNNTDWILIDADDVIVHIFQESARDAYGLEELWSEAQNVAIPSEYYFSSDQEASGISDDDKGRDFF